MIGEQLRKLRRTADLSQTQLGALVGVDRMTICRIERGQSISYDTAAKMAEVLGWRLVVKLEKVEEG
jgi:HTH-type transcriptional regulator / antitoxin HipB